MIILFAVELLLVTEINGLIRSKKVRGGIEGRLNLPSNK